MELVLHLPQCHSSANLYILYIAYIKITDEFHIEYSKLLQVFVHTSQHNPEHYKVSFKWVTILWTMESKNQQQIFSGINEIFLFNVNSIPKTIDLFHKCWFIFDLVTKIDTIFYFFASFFSNNKIVTVVCHLYFFFV